MDKLRDSIATSLSLKLFRTKEDAAVAHIYNSTLVSVPMRRFKNMENFNPARLQSSAAKAYPPNDRPRGAKDIRSVEFHRKNIRNISPICRTGVGDAPIWILKCGSKYTLLDGAHRIVAHHIEKKKAIRAYIITA